MSNETTSAPTIASPDDIDIHTANNAFNGTSFTPEKRGYLYRDGYADAVNETYRELWPMARSEEQKSILAVEMETFRQGFQSRMVAWLHARGRCLSPMITGGSNFPVASNQKKFSSADRRWDELEEWKAKARKAIKRKLLDARTPKEAEDAKLRGVVRHMASSLKTIGEIDRGGSYYTRSAFTTSITGKLTRMANNGQTSLVRRALEWLKANNHPNGPDKKPAIAARNKVWRLLETAEAVESVKQQDPELVSQTAGGVELWTDPSIDRVKIVFPDKPDSEVRGRLRSGGWRWSRANLAWQRKLTNSAVDSGRRILEGL